jgi:hypothetical protein
MGRTMLHQHLCRVGTGWCNRPQAACCMRVGAASRPVSITSQQLRTGNGYIHHGAVAPVLQEGCPQVAYAAGGAGGVGASSLTTLHYVTATQRTRC